MVKRSPTLGTLVSTKTKCIKLIFIGKITLVSVTFLTALSISWKRNASFSTFSILYTCTYLSVPRKIDKKGYLKKCNKETNVYFNTGKQEIVSSVVKYVTAQDTETISLKKTVGN